MAIFKSEAADVKEARKWKHLYLKFPKGVELSAKSINMDAGDDENLKLELVPITVAHPSLPGISHTALYAAWKVARADVKARKKGKLEQKNDKSDAALLLAKLAQGLDGMKME